MRSINVPEHESERMRLYKWLRLKLFIIAILMLSVSTAAQLPLYDLPEPFAHPVTTSGSMAQTRAGRLVVANVMSDSAAIIGLDRSIEAEVDVGADPRGVAITPNNLQAVVANVGDGTVTLLDLERGEALATYFIGGQLYHVVATDELAYISVRDQAAVVIVDLETGVAIGRISTPAQPTALALWGDFLYVTHFGSGEFSLIYLPIREVVRTLQVHPDATSLQAITIDRFAGHAFLPASQRMGERLAPMLYIVDLSTLRVLEAIGLNSDERIVSMPFAAAQPQNRSRLYVANAASDNVTIVDLANSTVLDHFDVGGNPRTILFNSQSTRVITHNIADQTLSVVGTGFFDLQDSPPTTNRPFSAEMQIGVRLFHTALDERLSGSSVMSCAGCHFDGQADGQSWNGVTIPVLAGGLAIDENFLNEHIRLFQGGVGVPASGLDMTALLNTLRQD